MRDLLFSWLMVALLVGGLGGYALHVVFHGRLRNERTEADGGSVLLRKPMMESVYWMLGPVVGWVAATGATPNQVTLFSLGPALGAGVALAYGWFGLGAVLATIAQFADVMDGLLARKLGMVSDAGAVLDSAVDRYVEILFLGGLAIHYRSSWMLVVVLAAIAAAFMVSYSTAKAEAKGLTPPRGAMRHAERGGYLLVGAAMTPFATLLAGEGGSLLARELPIIAAVLLVAIVGNASVVRRFASMTTSLANRHPRPGQPKVVEPAVMAEPTQIAESDTPLGAV
jgi:CDP-diacylglycerol---glycerol-3-phosphate 3-phosphatidyltransferase